MLDNRLVRTTFNLDDIRFATTLTSTSDYITLQPRHSVIYTGSDISVADGGALIPINVEEGIYIANISITTSDTSENWDIRILPNNTIYNTTVHYSDLVYCPTATLAIDGRYISSLSNSPFWSDIQEGYSDTPPISIYMILSTFTDRKHILWNNGDINGIAISSVIWDDTTTLWTKFGTLNFTWSAVATSFFNIRAHITRLI